LKGERGEKPERRVNQMVGGGGSGREWWGGGVCGHRRGRGGVGAQEAVGSIGR